MKKDPSFDLVVMGAGMAGLSAAAHASRRGLRVAVFEKAASVGGGSLLANGNVWTAPAIDALRAEDPSSDMELGRRLVDGFPGAIECVRALGQPCSTPTRALKSGTGWEIDLRAYFAACCREVIESGGVVETNATVSALFRDGDGVGGAIVTRGRRRETHRGRWTLLAGGGFHAHRALRRRFLGERADRLLFRGSPLASGDGLRLALAAGAATSAAMDRFYGHLVCEPSGGFRPEHFFSLAQYHSENGILLNRAGKRFTDESLGDHRNAERAFHEVDSRALLVIDDATRRRISPPASVMRAMDKIAAAVEAGCRVASATSLSDLAHKVSDWGYRGDELMATVAAYNDALARDAQPAIPRRSDRRAIAEPPFYALEVRPAISFTKGGIRIDPRSRALDARGAPVPGLLAAGNDAGGVFVDGYAGGLAAALVFGIQAADTTATGSDPHRP